MNKGIVIAFIATIFLTIPAVIFADDSPPGVPPVVPPDDPTVVTTTSEDFATVLKNKQEQANQVKDYVDNFCKTVTATLPKLVTSSAQDDTYSSRMTIVRDSCASLSQFNPNNIANPDNDPALKVYKSEIGKMVGAVDDILELLEK